MPAEVQLAYMYRWLQNQLVHRPIIVLNRIDTTILCQNLTVLSTPLPTN